MPKKLFVGNLPHEVTDTQLQDFIATAGFQSISAVVIRDKMTGQSRGFGFIELAMTFDSQSLILDFDVDVFRITAHQAVADPAADQ